MTKSKCPDRARDGFHDFVLFHDRRARRCYVDGLFEEWSIQRIWFIEYREHLERPVGQYAFDRVLGAGDERLDQNVCVGPLALDGDVRRLEQSPDAFNRVRERPVIIGANHTLAARKRQRLDNDRVRNRVQT